MKTITFLFFLLIMMTQMISGQTPPPPLEAGVPQSLAKWRAAHYSDVRYKLNITLEKMAPLMKGEIEIRVKLTEPGAKNDLILDWRATQFQNDKDKPFAEVVRVNEQIVKKTPPTGVFDYQINKEHLIISQKYLKTGENVIQIKFASPVKTSGGAITRYVDKEDGAEYIYSLFVPSDASTAFPVFDQPDLKARFQLNVSAPTEWKVVTNSSLYSQTVIKSEKISGFEETQPISTYVFAFAAGEFKQVQKTYPNEYHGIGSSLPDEDKKLLQEEPKGLIYVRKSQFEKFKPHIKEVFRLNREGVKFLESWFDYKFPFPKYDLVLIPEFPFGGMEHAGATFLREDRVIFPTEPTKNDFITRANLIFHEAAHQWFGDTVTMKWFDDLWLKEGFAEFMAYKTLEKVMPEYNAWKIFYERNKQAAYLTDVTRGTTPIYQEISNLSAAKSAYGNIVYRKAPSFLKQAEFYLGEKEFQTAVRSFLKKHEFKNAEWTDLVKEFETASKQDLKDWATTWVKQRGLKIFQVKRIEQGGSVEIIINSRDVLGEIGARKMKTLALINGKFIGESSSTLRLEGNEINEEIYLVAESHGQPSIDFYFPNYQDYGYGIFLLDEKSRAFVLENIQSEKDDFLRSMMWGSLWDSVRFYELAPEDYVELVIKNIDVESDESTIAALLGRVGVAMNYYLSDEKAEQFSPDLENLLLEKMRNAPTPGQKITYYRAFLNIASSEKARNLLKILLKPKTKDQRPLFELKTKDKFDVVTRLITLGDPDGLKLLAGLEKTERDDAAKSYAYAARAGIPTAENKAKFWNDFVNNKEISESWIESAFAVWNSPKHSDLTLPYLEKALAELPNLKRNRKIFFVKGWLSSFIGGQKSAEALKIVNDFLEKNPNLDRDLRLKILENVDGLERAVKIREVK